MSTIEVKVPNIGDFKEVEVIEVMVKVGDTIKVDQSLITVESDKASMEIPASHAGVVKEIKVKVGDKIAEGSMLLVLDEAGGAAAAPAAAAPAAAAPAPAAAAPAAVQAPAAQVAAAPAPTMAKYDGKVDIECEMMVLGAGPGGYSAAFRSADLGMNTVLIERYASLGGVCLNVGCIPSKALLHVAAVIDETQAMSKHGISFAKPEVDIDQLRAYKDKVITKMTTGLAGMAKMRKVNVVQGVGQFVSANHIEVTAADGSKKVVQFQKAIIAAGSAVVNLPFVPKDPRIVDSTGALELRQIPKRMLVIGGGIIGLEMATVYSTTRCAHRRGRNARWPDAGRRPRHRQGVAKVQREALRQGHDQNQDGGRGSAGRRHQGLVRSGESRRHRARAADATTWCSLPSAAAPNGKKIAADKAGVDGYGSRFHSGRRANAHQRAAYLRHRRPGGPADAGAQGGA